VFHYAWNRDSIRDWNRKWNRYAINTAISVYPVPLRWSLDDFRDWNRDWFLRSSNAHSEKFWLKSTSINRRTNTTISMHPVPLVGLLLKNRQSPSHSAHADSNHQFSHDFQHGGTSLVMICTTKPEHVFHFCTTNTAVMTKVGRPTKNRKIN